MLKQFVKLFVITFCILSYTSLTAKADTNIVYLDLKKIMNESVAGKKAQDYLEKKHKENLADFKKSEEKLKKEEADLISKRQVLDKDQYMQESEKLRTKARDYANKRRDTIQKLAKTRTDARTQLLMAIQPILQEYSEANNIDLVLDKKDVIIGKKNIDITAIIIEELNKKIPSLKLN